MQGKNGKEELRKKISDIISSIRWNEIGDESVSLLRDLIRVDTTNPPGDEYEAAILLQRYFNSFNIESRMVESDPKRVSIISDLKGEDTKLKPLILLSHLDVVPANPKEWSVPPFSGEVKNGYVWGRGAIDCKGLAVCEAVAMSLVKRLRIPIRRTIRYISVADEEMGGEKGAKFVVENENIEGFGVINEGGTGAILNGKKIYLPCFGEKGPLWLKIVAKGKSGHASMPHKENPNLILLSALSKISETNFGREFTKNFIKAIDVHVVRNSKMGTILSPLLSIAEKSKAVRKILGEILYLLLQSKPKLQAMVSNTLSITMIKSGYKENVIPEEAEAVIDIRLLPGYSYFDVIEKMKAIVNDPRISFEILTMHQFSESSPEEEFFLNIRYAVQSVYNYPFFPILATGFTDSRFFRSRNIPSYGLLPFFLTEEEVATMHGIDERISIENLIEGVKLMLSIILFNTVSEKDILGF